MDIQYPSQKNKEKEKPDLPQEPVIRTMAQDMASLKKGGKLVQSVPFKPLSKPFSMGGINKKPDLEKPVPGVRPETRKSVPPPGLPVKEPEKAPLLSDVSKEISKQPSFPKSKPVQPSPQPVPKPDLLKLAPKKQDLAKPLPRSLPKPLEKKPIHPITPKKSLNFIFIGLAVILVLGGTGGFFYWWYYLRIEPVHSVCQADKCVQVQGEGTDECILDAECAPIAPVMPSSLLPVDQTQTIQIDAGQETLILEKIKAASLEPQEINSLKRILIQISDLSGSNYADLDQILSGLGISLPSQILQKIAETDPPDLNYTLFLYNQLQGNRLGIVFEMQSGLDIAQDLKTWENTLKNDLANLLLKDIIPQAASQEFLDNIYQDIAIRYINFPEPDLSIDYAVIANKLIIATSRESMYSGINALK